MPGLSALKPLKPGQPLLQERGDEGEREEAVDHGRHAGQDLEHRLDDAAHAVGRVLAQVDGAQQAGRARPRPSRSPRRAACPRTSGSTPKCLVAKSGVHSVPVRNSSSGTSRKNADGLDGQHRDDADGRAHREHRAQRTAGSRSGVRPGGSDIRRLYCVSRASSCSMVSPTCDPACSKTEPVRAGLVVLGDQLVAAVAERHVADLFGQGAALGQVEVDEAGHLRPVERRGRHVDEHRARQRLVGAALHGLDAGQRSARRRCRPCRRRPAPA